MSEAKLILGIESSCDETAASVVLDGREVLSSVVHSQIDQHAQWGGVVPEIAGRSHLEQIVPTIQTAISEAGVLPNDLSAIAVTARPGLLGSLLIGVSAAKSMAWAFEKPLIDIHHIEAHIYAALMPIPSWEFPYITLVVSGGHTSLYQTDSPLTHTLLACTRDDAAGEALDKGAAMLGLPYPGGPSIEKEASSGNPKAFPFKLPLMGPDSLEFSFSGLKTALLYTLKGPGGKRTDPTLPGAKNLSDLCASFEHAVTETLAQKCMRACEQKKIPRLLIGGGVARNSRLRERVAHHASQHDIQATFAPPEFCTDNAVMIAGLGYAKLTNGDIASLDLDVAAR
ncbi:MAG: tRNA (adenosine(37)-N6)-threonylcarbamoyltransferase complex transferase subunit TsaD [Planctomycetes bacterium]|nr:tRNA (adenosine(37)-N6)-threonylcarbamoyltransferase complex transferase subunit TsaD [Planctomycetota bacterium]MDP6128962.1 tRNA (adenosine(37)-N6)-threonylcarbamoyltransferase complex transferase subunit TsaD [Planctomycetota bacterium]MDP7245113.1 tRNA (adenosine(37)-N6)-threonylcarbamoyltransferase complex transferase subunit TsaD [Planctomycetota bacterium]